MKDIRVFYVFLIFALGMGCKELYKPTIISDADSYLVVEGVLNAGPGPTQIRLTNTFKLDDTARLKSEPNAQVIVEGKDNSTQQLTMTGDGLYTSPGLNLVLGQEYRLRIKTAGGKEYLSDYLMTKKTPPIDSLEWRRDDKGVHVYANTHDASNGTWYYRWDYDETWEIHSYYHTTLEYVNGTVVRRPPGDDVYTCWKYGFSHNILLGSSARLASDIIIRAPITTLPEGDEKLSVRYSILLRQYAIDKTGYEFYELMKKNTENLGTLFDAQPSELSGNIHCVSDPGELVIGYLTAVSIEEKRFFITSNEIGGWHFYQDCPQERVVNHPDSIQLVYNGGGSFFGAVSGPNGITTHYIYSKDECVECPKRGGSLNRPSYW